MNSTSCDRCGTTTDEAHQFDFCAECGADLCPGCFAVGCCGLIPAPSGTGRANVLYRIFGDTSPCPIEAGMVRFRRDEKIPE